MAKNANVRFSAGAVRLLAAMTPPERGTVMAWLQEYSAEWGFETVFETDVEAAILWAKGDAK